MPAYKSAEPYQLKTTQWANRFLHPLGNRCGVVPHTDQDPAHLLWAGQQNKA